MVTPPQAQKPRRLSIGLAQKFDRLDEHMAKREKINNLTPKDKFMANILRIKGYFKDAEVSEDGLISRKELEKVFSTFSNWTPAQFDELFSSFPPDFNGKVSCEDLINNLFDIPKPPEPIYLDAPPAIGETSSVTYKNGVTVTFDKVSPSLKPYLDQIEESGIFASQQIKNYVEGARYMANLQECFQDALTYCVSDEAKGNASLNYEKQEVFAFVLLVFDELNLPEPDDDSVFNTLAEMFGSKQNTDMSELSCKAMVDSILRLIYLSDSFDAE